LMTVEGMTEKRAAIPKEPVLLRDHEDESLSAGKQGAVQ